MGAPHEEFTSFCYPHASTDALPGRNETGFPIVPVCGHEATSPVHRIDYLLQLVL
jgi:hypothetical protein